MSSKFDYRKYKNYDEQSFEGNQHPIYMRPATEAYREAWERIFGDKHEGVENERIGKEGDGTPKQVRGRS